MGLGDSSIKTIYQPDSVGLSSKSVAIFAQRKQFSSIGGHVVFAIAIRPKRILSAETPLGERISGSTVSGLGAWPGRTRARLSGTKASQNVIICSL